MKAADPHARWRVVERWLRVAANDRQTVMVRLAADPPLLASAAFHCQQALEKLFKGFLTLAGKRGGKTHSLSRLGAAAAASFPDVANLVAAAENWSDWATQKLLKKAKTGMNHRRFRMRFVINRLGCTMGQG